MSASVKSIITHVMADCYGNIDYFWQNIDLQANILSAAASAMTASFALFSFHYTAFSRKVNGKWAKYYGNEGAFRPFFDPFHPRKIDFFPAAW